MHLATNSSSALSVEGLTEPIECESITTGINELSLFRMSKKGFVRLVRDNRKRFYAVELFHYDPKNVFPEDKTKPLKPLYTFEVPSFCQKINSFFIINLK